MKLFIAPMVQILSKFLLLSVLFGAISQFSYAQFLNKKWPSAKIITPNSEVVSISWAITPSEKVQGLSDLDKNAMPKGNGLFFYYSIDEKRTFWMPSTRFNLDIIFLDKDLNVVGVESNIKKFPKRSPEHLIPRTKSYLSRYVLELHAGEAKKLGIKKGSVLKWKKPDYIKKFFKKLY